MSDLLFLIGDTHTNSVGQVCYGGDEVTIRSKVSGKHERETLRGNALAISVPRPVWGRLDMSPCECVSMRMCIRVRL